MGDMMEWGGLLYLDCGGGRRGHLCYFLRSGGVKIEYSDTAFIIGVMCYQSRELPKKRSR